MNVQQRGRLQFNIVDQVSQLFPDVRWSPSVTAFFAQNTICRHCQTVAHFAALLFPRLVYLTFRWKCEVGASAKRKMPVYSLGSWSGGFLEGTSEVQLFDLAVRLRRLSIGRWPLHPSEALSRDNHLVFSRRTGYVLQNPL